MKNKTFIEFVYSFASWNMVTGRVSGMCVRFLLAQLAFVFLLSTFVCIKPLFAEQVRQLKTQVQLFQENERVLDLAPHKQSAWAEQYASKHKFSTNINLLRQTAVKAFLNDPPGMIAQVNLLTYLLITGDTIAAMEGYMKKNPKADRSAKLSNELNQLRRARSRIIRNFASKKPPRAYAGENPSTAARAQDKSQRYTQFVQLSTQTMNELQNTERELVDTLQTMKRDLDSLWQQYASMRDNEFRTDERIMNVR